MSTILTYVAVQNGSPSRASLEVLTRARQFAEGQGATMAAVVLATDASVVVDELARYGAQKVYTVSHRIFAPPDYASTFPMQWRHLLRLIWPHHFGVFPNFWPPDDAYAEVSLFVGRIPLALALLAVGTAMARTFSGRPDPATREWRIAVWSLAALAAFSVLYAAGPNGPLFAPLTRLAPPLDSFRVPARMLFYLDLSLALLAAAGLQRLLGRLKSGHGGA